jgi:hypothetical protein
MLSPTNTLFETDSGLSIMVGSFLETTYRFNGSATIRSSDDQIVSTLNKARGFTFGKLL